MQLTTLGFAGFQARTISAKFRINIVDLSDEQSWDVEEKLFWSLCLGHQIYRCISNIPPKHPLILVFIFHGNEKVL